MVRATVRQRELAVRAALGAAQGRLIRQLLTESLILAVSGGIAGAMLGRWSIGMLSQIRLPGDLPFRFDFVFDWRVFGYIAAVALRRRGRGTCFRRSALRRPELNAVLREGGPQRREGSGRHRMRGLLVIGQVAMSLVLLVAAGLFVRSAMNARLHRSRLRPVARAQPLGGRCRSSRVRRSARPGVLRRVAAARAAAPRRREREPGVFGSARLLQFAAYHRDRGTPPVRKTP